MKRKPDNIEQRLVPKKTKTQMEEPLGKKITKHLEEGLAEGRIDFSEWPDAKDKNFPTIFFDVINTLNKEQLSQVTVLNMSGTGIGGRPIKLEEMIRRLPNLKHLDLTGCHLNTPLRLHKIAQNILPSCPNLTTLILNDNVASANNVAEKPNTDTTDAAFIDLLRALKGVSKLQTLEMANNNIKNALPEMIDRAKEIFHQPSVFSELSALKTFNIAGNSLDDAGMQRIAGQLQHCPTLEVLHINGNPVSPEAVRALPERIKQCIGQSLLAHGQMTVSPEGASASSSSSGLSAAQSPTETQHALSEFAPDISSMPSFRERTSWPSQILNFERAQITPMRDGRPAESSLLAEFAPSQNWEAYAVQTRKNSGPQR